MRSQRTAPSIRLPVRRRSDSWSHLNLLVGGAGLAVNHGELVGKSEQAFRMAHEQIAARIQAAVKFFDQTFLFGLVEIHHYVAAENNVVALRQVFGFEVMEVEMDQFLERLLDGIALADFIEMT